MIYHIIYLISYINPHKKNTIKFLLPAILTLPPSLSPLEGFARPPAPVAVASAGPAAPLSASCSPGDVETVAWDVHQPMMLWFLTSLKMSKEV
jgi:hypothetical protein